MRIDYAAQLNEEQLRVVTAPAGPMLVIAGAGSGKTRTVTYRVARLIEDGADPSRILLVTFTNKAAREMLHRVSLLVGKRVRLLWGGTFHHIGHAVLRRHGPLLGYAPGFSILDREDARDLIDTCMGELGIDRRGRLFPKPDVVGDLISMAVNTQRPLEEVTAERAPYFIELTPRILEVAQRYAEKKRRLNAVDFDDLLEQWRRLLVERPDVGLRYAERFEHILVDEYQDTNRLQAELVDRLAEVHRNVLVVGDDAQSIYSFRGASFDNIMEFPKRYPDAVLYRLEINYRSTPQILALANDGIRHNLRQFPKELRTARPEGPRPRVFPTRDVLDQASIVAEQILELHGEGIPLAEIAVLYRSHYHSMELQMELVRRGIPFAIRSGLKFFEQAHVKDVTAHLKVIANPRDELAWKRTLRLLPRVGRATADKLYRTLSGLEDPVRDLTSDRIGVLVPKGAREAWAPFVRLLARLDDPAVRRDPAGMIERVVEGPYGEHLRLTYPDAGERAEDLRQLARFAARYRSVEEFLQELALLGSVEVEAEAGTDGDEDRVILSTIHQAKGLEWTAVFVIWLTEGRFPSGRALGRSEDEEEERRLFYVAATRTRTELILTYPIMMEGWQQASFLPPSRFLRELDPALYEERAEDPVVREILDRYYWPS